MGTLTSYGAHNFQLEQDYQIRLDQTQIGEPQVYVSCDASSGAPARIMVDRWNKYTQIEEASFSYVGMDYETALSCAQDMRDALTFNYYQPWAYENYMQGNKFYRGWHQLTSQYLPKLESTVDVAKNGVGGMYDVKVNARLTLESYRLNGNAGYGSRPLLNALGSVPGWNSDTGAWTDGKAVLSAGDNISLVAAPSYTDEWKLVAQNVRVVNGLSNSLSAVAIDQYYEVNTTYRAAVKYEGMTLSACRALYNRLNNFSTGWELTSNPWVLSATLSGTNWDVKWVKDTRRTNYQCLNRVQTRREGGKMWTMELQLEARVQNVMKNGHQAEHTWPAVWSRIPGMSRFLQ